MEIRTATAAASAVPEMVRNAAAGIPTTITNQGHPVAVVIPFEEYRARSERRALLPVDPLDLRLVPMEQGEIWTVTGKDGGAPYVIAPLSECTAWVSSNAARHLESLEAYDPGVSS